MRWGEITGIDRRSALSFFAFRYFLCLVNLATPDGQTGCLIPDSPILQKFLCLNIVVGDLTLGLLRIDGIVAVTFLTNSRTS